MKKQAVIQFSGNPVCRRLPPEGFIQMPVPKLFALHVGHNKEVGETLILAKVAVHELDWDIAEHYANELSGRLKSVEGFLGFSLWRNCDEPVNHLLLYRYRDEEAADEGLKVLADERFLTEVTTIPMSPPDVIRVLAEEFDGDPIEASDHSCFLSLSERVAEPGYGRELNDEIQRIFAELRLISGYRGSIYGHRDTLDEEIVGIVVWGSKAAFLASLPPKIVYEVKLYRRVV